MNVTSMLVGYATGALSQKIANIEPTGTLAPHLVRDKAENKATLDRGREKRTAMALARKQRVVEMIARGHSCEELVQLFKVSAATIRADVQEAVRAGQLTFTQAKASYPPSKPMKERNLSGNRGPQQKTMKLREQIEKAIDRAGGAMSVSDLAKEFDMSYYTMTDHLRKMAGDGTLVKVKSNPVKYRRAE